MSCSVMSETVLRCRPETRARSAREIGCRRRIKFRMTPRLMARAVSLDATSVFVKLVRRIKGCKLAWSQREILSLLIVQNRGEILRTPGYKFTCRTIFGAIDGCQEKTRPNLGLMGSEIRN